MLVEVPIEKDPMIREKLTLEEKEKKKDYLVGKKILGEKVLYLLPGDFPLSLVKVLFGKQAKVRR